VPAADMNIGKTSEAVMPLPNPPLYPDTVAMDESNPSIGHGDAGHQVKGKDRQLPRTGHHEATPCS
jgi:hypothetical protein